MALFNRTYTFVDGTTAYGSQVESELSNIVTVLNSLNAATTTWGQVSVAHATSVPLISDCSSGTQNIAEFKNNNTTKASIASTGALTIVPTSNQIVLGATRTITISAGTPASASRVVSIPDPGADCNVILSKGTPTMGAALAMGSNKITGLANGTASGDASAFGQVTVIKFTGPTFTTTKTSSTSTSYADVTDLTLSITPGLSTSHVRIAATVSIKTLGTSGQICLIDLAITDSSNNIIKEWLGLGGLDLASTVAMYSQVQIVAWDAPGSASAKTYKVRLKRNTNSGGGTVVVNEVVGQTSSIEAWEYNQ